MSRSRLTVGSSPFCSSPTSASHMKRRISAVGFVMVSLKRSIRIWVGMKTSFENLITRLFAQFCLSQCELTLPAELLPLIVEFAPLFSKSVWEHANIQYSLSSIHSQ